MSTRLALIASAVLVATEAFKHGETSASTPDFHVALSSRGGRAACRIKVFNCPITPMEKMRLPRLVSEQGWRWNGDLSGKSDEQDHGLPEGALHFELLRQPEDLLSSAEAEAHMKHASAYLETEAWVATVFGRENEPCRT